jgi:hypothetical protein
VPATGTSNSNKVLTAGPTAGSASWSSLPAEIGLVCSDNTTDLEVNAVNPVVSIRMPYAMLVTGVRANVIEAPTGSAIRVHIQYSDTGINLLSTACSIDAGETTSVTAATQPVLSNPSLSDDTVVKVWISQVGSTTTGKGLKVWLLGVRS